MPRRSRTAPTRGAGVAPRDGRAPSAPRSRPVERGWLSDSDLADLALAAAGDDRVGPDAVPLRIDGGPGLLGAWYMPAASASRVSGWRTPVVVTLVVTLLVLEALGLCSVFGQVVAG